MYLRSFTLPTAETERALLESRALHNGGPYGYVDNTWPCGLFTRKDFREVNFGKITIFYGGNGSGKSTLLNIIAEKLGLDRVAPFNTGEMLASYVKSCRYALEWDDEGFERRISGGSRIITSDDIFDYMLTVRTNNEDIGESKEDAREKWVGLKFGDTVKFGGMEDYEALRMQVLARKKSLTRRQFIRRTAGQEAALRSNGETALEYFRLRLRPDTLCCLDEPENSMSPRMQRELAKMLEEMVRYCGCQFILATHSPFLLALDGAKIYDLDASPVTTKNWWELENTQMYYAFFKEQGWRFE